MKRLLAYTGIAAVLLASCIKEPKQWNDEEVPADKLRLTLNIDGLDAELATRSTVIPEQGEDRLSSLYLLFFRSDASRNGEFIDYVKVENSAGINTNVDIYFDAYSQLRVTEAYHILAITNIAGYDYLQGNAAANWMANWHGKTENEVLTEAEAYVRGSISPNDDDVNRIRSNILLMNGRAEKAKEQFHIAITLSRNLARFDVHNMKQAEYDLVSASIWNAYEATSIWEGSGNYSNNVPRMRRFYGVTNGGNVVGSDSKGDIFGNISGGLYAFENQVAAPKQNDKLTTCIIVGLVNRSDPNKTTKYYRANIHPGDEAQVIRANNVYRLTIRSVSGAGYDTEQFAYEGAERQFDYVINYWDLDDHGLIVQNGNSILSVPVKTINIKPEGEIITLPVFTFNNVGGAPPLFIKSQSYNPSTGDIGAYLNGNDLIVEAAPLALSETERTGQITLFYGGLEATVNVIQTKFDEMYLKVHLPAGGLPSLSSFAGFPSEQIRVEASGAWTARLYMDGFSFSAAQPLTTLSSSDIVNVSNNNFHVYTRDNNNETSIREGFVIVSLDQHQEKFSSVFRVVQNMGSVISVSPNLSSHAFASISPASVQFAVFPGEENSLINEWDWVILQKGFSDHRARFTADTTSSRVNQARNVITVQATGNNTSDVNYEAILRIFQKAAPSNYVEINLTQKMLELRLIPSSLPPVPVTGGKSAAIEVETAPTLRWSATIITTCGAASDGRNLVNHAAVLITESGNTVNPGATYPASEKFYVAFPKIYYPNREIPNITATVTVTVEGITATATVKQTSLTSKGFNATGFGGGGGELLASGSNYNEAYSTMLRSITGYNYIGAVPLAGTNAISSNTTFLHIANAQATSSSVANAITKLNNFRNNPSFDGLTLLAGDYRGSYNLQFSNQVMDAGYTIVDAGSFGNENRGQIVTEPAVMQTRVYQFLMRHCWTELLVNGNQILLTGTFYGNRERAMASAWPADAVTMITDGAGRPPTLIIDPARKLIFFGESEYFNTGYYDPVTNVAGSGELSGYRGAFLHNLTYYIANAARYGSHFTDLLRDDLGLPSLWDPVWGANAWDRTTLPVNP